MATQSFEKAWQSYQASVQMLYRAPQAALAQTERGAGEVYQEQLEQYGQAAADQSAQVREALQAGLKSRQLDRRELASLKLLATAVYDLSVASDILELEQSTPEVGVERSARSVLLANPDVRDVLEISPDAGMAGLVEVERAANPTDPQAARAALKKAIPEFIKAIPEDSAETGWTAASGLVNLGIAPIQGAASLAFQNAISKAPKLSKAAESAAKLVEEAIRKLRSLLGKDLEEAIQEKAEEWAKDFKKDRSVTAKLLDKLYQTEAAGKEALALLDKAPADLPASAFNQATNTLEVLTGGYDKTCRTLNAVMNGLALFKTPLLAAVPWGPIGVYAVYTGILGYAVYSGGDYLDWKVEDKAKWLDRVKGLKTTIKKELKPPAK